MKDAHQNTTYVYDELPTGLPYEKLPWHANPYLHTGLLAICSVLLLSAILAVPGGFVLRLIKKDQPHTTEPLSRVSRFLAFLVAALDLVGLGLFLFIFLGSGEAILYGQNAILNIMLGTWLVAAILTVPLLVLAVLSWKKHSWGVAIRVHYSLVVVACLAFTWFLSYWNMLGFRY
jgi:hypothetical protein